MKHSGPFTCAGTPVYGRRLPVALDGTVIVAVSDLHLGSLLGKTWLAALVEQVEAEKPDLVVRIGEVFEGHSVPAAEMLTVLKAMPALLGKWGVFGNHEMHSGGDANGAIFEGAGITCCEMAGSNCAQASSWLA